MNVVRERRENRQEFSALGARKQRDAGTPRVNKVALSFKRQDSR